MQKQQTKSLHITLWVLQILVGSTLLYGAYMKLFIPIEELGKMWSWMAEVPLLAKTTGVIDGLAGLGLILPGLLKIQPKLTFYAALGVALLMICASLFHILRGEASDIGFNIVMGILAGIIIWGRK